MINSFTFYRDYFNLIDTLPNKQDKMILLEAITDYMFKDIEPQLDGHNKAIFNTLKYQLDVSKNNAGRGGRKSKEKTEQQTELKTDKKPNDKPIENRKENRLKSKTSISNFKFYISNLDINNSIKELLYKWLEYKQDIKDMYKSEKSIKTLVKQITDNCDIYGEEKVNEVVDESIRNGYKGLFFDKLKKQNNGYNKKTAPVPDWFNKSIEKEEELTEEERRLRDELIRGY